MTGLSGWTLALQALNFLILAWLLQRLLYKPIQKVFAERKREAEKGLSRAAAEAEQAQVLRRELDAEREGMSAERDRQLRETRELVERERQAALAQARREADELVGAVRRQLDEERGRALAELRGAAVTLACQLASRLLREAGSPAVTAALFNRIEAKLGELPPEQLAALRRDLAGGAGLEVAVAASLDPAEQARWCERLQQVLGPTAIAFRTDPELMGGAELHLPSAALRFSWRDALQAAQRELEEDDDAA
jgi:F-type H+-transporting ATPase subunit b